MDAFFASIEQRDDPRLKGRPVCVGGDPGGRGVVAAASYEARRFGIRSAMPCREAYRRCPDAIFIPPRIGHYAEVGQQIRAIFHEVTDLVEPLSLDEAYLDVTTNHLDEPLASKVARWIKSRIRGELNLVASAGVGPNKFIAKIASDLRKPDGLVIIPPERVAAFVETLSVAKLWGVGPATRERLAGWGIRTAGDLRRRPLSEMVERMGKHGAFLHGLAHGIDPRRVTPTRAPKSRGSERTFAEDVRDIDVLLGSLQSQCDRVAKSLVKMDRDARTVTLKLRYEDFTTVTRSRTVETPFRAARQIETIASALLLSQTEAGTRPVRLIGVSVSGFRGETEPAQLLLPLEAGAAASADGFRADAAARAVSESSED